MQIVPKKRNTYDFLLNEWSLLNPDKLSDYTIGSHHSAIWKCRHGHEWPAIIKARFNGNGCPYCSGRNAIKGETDLQTIYPELAKEWHTTNNGTLTPSDVTSKSHKRVWWQCQYGHEWPARIFKRAEGKGCPVCGHRIVCDNQELNDDTPVNKTGLSLKTLYPKIAEEWDYDKNKLSPEQFLPSSNKRVFWKCKKGHEWPAIINSRTRKERPTQCPYCAGKRAIPGENDLLTTDPTIAAEWSYEMNRISPTEVTRMSHKKVYWKCQKGHIYRSVIENHTAGKGCPICKGKITIQDK